MNHFLYVKDVNWRSSLIFTLSEQITLLISYRIVQDFLNNSHWNPTHGSTVFKDKSWKNQLYSTLHKWIFFHICVLVNTIFNKDFYKYIKRHKIKNCPCLMKKFKEQLADEHIYFFSEMMKRCLTGVFVFNPSSPSGT